MLFQVVFHRCHVLSPRTTYGMSEYRIWLKLWFDLIWDLGWNNVWYQTKSNPNKIQVYFYSQITSISSVIGVIWDLICDLAMRFDLRFANHWEILMIPNTKCDLLEKRIFIDIFKNRELHHQLVALSLFCFLSVVFHNSGVYCRKNLFPTLWLSNTHC